MYHRMVFKAKWEHQWLRDTRQTANQKLDMVNMVSKNDLINYTTTRFIADLKYCFEVILEIYIINSDQKIP